MMTTYDRQAGVTRVLSSNVTVTYEIQYQQLSSCSKSLVRRYLKGSHCFLKYSSF